MSLSCCCHELFASLLICFFFHPSLLLSFHFIRIHSHSLIHSASSLILLFYYPLAPHCVFPPLPPPSHTHTHTAPRFCTQAVACPLKPGTALSRLPYPIDISSLYSGPTASRGKLGSWPVTWTTSPLLSFQAPATHSTSNTKKVVRCGRVHGRGHGRGGRTFPTRASFQDPTTEAGKEDRQCDIRQQSQSTRSDSIPLGAVYSCCPLVFLFSLSMQFLWFAPLARSVVLSCVPNL